MQEEAIFLWSEAGEQIARKLGGFYESAKISAITYQGLCTEAEFEAMQPDANTTHIFYFLDSERAFMRLCKEGNFTIEIQVSDLIQQTRP